MIRTFSRISVDPGPVPAWVPEHPSPFQPTWRTRVVAPQTPTAQEPPPPVPRFQEQPRLHPYPWENPSPAQWAAAFKLVARADVDHDAW